MYKHISLEDGREFLGSIWNMFFKPLTEADFFVEPWDQRALRDCAEFQLSNGLDEIYFFVREKELKHFLENVAKKKEQVYLFGAYNQVYVCQMRAIGMVTLGKKHPEETKKIRNRLRRAIQSRVGASNRPLSKEEAKKRYSILRYGTLFCFHVKGCAYSEYERG